MKLIIIDNDALRREKNLVVCEVKYNAIKTFIRHFRFFSKRCPNCNQFKENGKKHSFNDCFEALKKKIIRKLLNKNQ